MDDQEDLKIEGPEVTIKTKRAKNGNSKIFSCLLFCLKNALHSHMLKYTNKSKTEFEVRLLNKKSSEWRRKDISLFEELDGLSSKYHESDKYPEMAKVRFNANMSKLCKSKYIEEKEGYPKKTSKCITIKRYKILKFPHEVMEEKKCRKKKRVSSSEGIPVENICCIPTMSHYSCLSGEPLKVKAILEGNITYGNVSSDNIYKSVLEINQNDILEGNITYGNVSAENIYKSVPEINQNGILEGNITYGNASSEDIYKSVPEINQTLAPERNVTLMDVENTTMTEEESKDFLVGEDKELLTFCNEACTTELWNKNRCAMDFSVEEDNEVLAFRNETCTTQLWSVNESDLDPSPLDGSLFEDTEQYDDNLKTSDPLLSSTVEPSQFSIYADNWCDEIYGDMNVYEDMKIL